VTDLDRIYATIIDQPDEDAWRLQYADCLDDHAGTVVCPTCEGDGRSRGKLWASTPHCPTCRGSGDVSNGFAERAKFIRLQVAEAREDGSPSWRTCQLAQRLPVDGLRVFANPASFVQWSISPAALYRRGFVDEVRCPLRTWCGGECEYIGRAGRRCDHGLILLGDGTYECPACRGTGRVTGIGPAVVRSHPVRRVVTDREPWRNEDGSFSWWMMYEGTSEELADIPERVWKLLPHVDGFGCGRPTRDAALDSLSSALLAWAKSAPV
jgi:uncharacterized protein (TIGR02996 family)